VRKYFFPVRQIKEIEHLEKLCIRVESDSNPDREYWLSIYSFVNIKLIIVYFEHLKTKKKHPAIFK